jgi:asparagine synthase (glutamine-hydrolysing)
MTDQDESVWVVFNGEIYNFPELRTRLESRGHVFRTRSDTEVIIHGYKEWGTGVFSHLNGMFGLAIWDVRRRRLVLARDAMGMKLVYYHVHSGSLLFGSEVRAILAAVRERPELDITAANLFLRYRYVPSPLTLYQGINKLAPGSMATFEDGAWRVERWYHLAPAQISHTMSDEEQTEVLLEMYQRAIKRHLLSDVPVGLLLSGGIDSGLLLGLMSLTRASWPTYTVGYGSENHKDDELIDAQQTARLFSAKHVRQEISVDSFVRILPRIVSVLEEPVAASSIVPMYFVCERASRDVKVALMGQGPDELFGGYTRHLGIHYGRYWRGLPAWLRASMESGVNLLPRSEALKRGVHALGEGDALRRYQEVFSLLPGRAIDNLFKEGALPEGAGDKVLQFWGDLQPDLAHTDELGSFQTLELRSSLPDELLMYADKLSMAHGLEIRVPFLDREIVEHVQGLPARFKVRYGERKWLHRQVCKGFLPSAILRRKKRGFSVNVVDDWFRGSKNVELNGYLRDSQSRMFEFLRPDVVDGLLGAHRRGMADNHKILFSLVVLEEWLRSHGN